MIRRTGFLCCNNIITAQQQRAKICSETFPPVKQSWQRDYRRHLRPSQTISHPIDKSDRTTNPLNLKQSLQISHGSIPAAAARKKNRENPAYSKDNEPHRFHLFAPNRARRDLLGLQSRRGKRRRFPRPRFARGTRRVCGLLPPLKLYGRVRPLPKSIISHDRP